MYVCVCILQVALGLGVFVREVIIYEVRFESSPCGVKLMVLSFVSKFGTKEC